jgi:hypothetical protein
MIPCGSVQRLAFGLEDKVSWFDPRQAASGVHPASYSVRKLLLQYVFYSVEEYYQQNFNDCVTKK